MLSAEQDPFPQKVEVGTAEHLPFEGFDPADVAFHRAAAVVQGAVLRWPIAAGGRLVG